MTSNALRIIIVDNDPSQLWALSNFLKLADYEVLEAGSGEQALSALEYYRPHLLIAGWKLTDMSGVELCRRLHSGNRSEYTFVLLLNSTTDSNALVEALQAGADDFLAQPLVYGELLSRLRAGARMVEFETRLRRLGRTDPLTGLGTRLMFNEALARSLAASAGRRGAVSCVLADIDFFSHIGGVYGRRAAETALKAIAERLQQCTENEHPLCRVGDNRFALLHDSASEAETVAWAEKCRLRIAGQPISLGAETLTLDFSFGAACATPETTPEALYNLAEQALKVAKQSGRNRVVGAGSIAGITTGRAAVDPLRSAVARDIMTSNVFSLGQHETLEAALEFFHDSKLASLPVVNPDEQLLGMVSLRDLQEHLAAPSLTQRTVGEILALEAPCYEEEATVQTLFEFFQNNEANRVEIVHGGRPTGYVTRGSLAALGDPVALDSFSSPTPAANRSDYLLVTDLELVEMADCGAE